MQGGVGCTGIWYVRGSIHTPRTLCAARAKGWLHTKEITEISHREPSTSSEGRARNPLGAVSIQHRLGAGASLHGVGPSPCAEMIAGRLTSSPAPSFILLQQKTCSEHVFYPTKGLCPGSVFTPAVFCPSRPLRAPPRADLRAAESIEFHPEHTRGREEGCTLHFKSRKHILRALLLSVLQFLRKTQLRKDFGRNPKVTFACLFQVMHMHACKTQALVVSASGLKAMA